MLGDRWKLGQVFFDILLDRLDLLMELSLTFISANKVIP